MSDSRAEFESWCKFSNQDITRDDREDWGYMNMITHELWVGWDAAWNRRAQPERKLTDEQVFAGIQCVVIAAVQEYTRCNGIVPDWDLGFFYGQLHIFEQYLNADKTAIAEAKDYISKLQKAAAAQPAAATVPRIDEDLISAAKRTRDDLGDTGDNYPDVRRLLSFAEAAISAQAQDDGEQA